MNKLKVSLVHADHTYIDQLCEVENACFNIPWSRDALLDDMSKNLFAEYIAAVVDNKVVGYAGMWKIIDEGHITNIAVHPDYRGRKVGRKLLNGLIANARKSRLKLLTLEVRISNDIARKLYETSGFEVVGQRRRYYADNNEDAIIMTRVF